MGLDWNYSGPDEVYDELSGCMESMKNISWERLVNEGAVTYPCDDSNKPGNEVIFGEGFPTENKKGRLVPAKIVSPDETPDSSFSSNSYNWKTSGTLAYWINDIKIQSFEYN